MCVLWEGTGEGDLRWTLGATCGPAVAGFGLVGRSHSQGTGFLGRGQPAGAGAGAGLFSLNTCTWENLAAGPWGTHQAFLPAFHQKWKASMVLI